MKLGEIADMLGGQLLSGLAETEITGARGLEDASSSDVAFLADKKHLKAAAASRAACVLVSEFQERISAAQLKVRDPQQAFVRLLEHFHPARRPPAGIDARAFVSPSASVAEGATVQAFAYVSDRAAVGKGTVVHPFVYVGEDVTVGEQCVLRPGVVLMDGVRLGNRVVVHSNSVIGSDGFGYFQRGGANIKIPQVGGVVIEDDVEVGACTVIDRAATGDTVIGKGTKIDNLVQVAHNVRIGEHSIIVSQAGIAGSSVIGSRVMLGGQVGVADHTTIEDETKIAAKGGALGHVKKGVYGGTLMMPHKDWLKSSALFAKLPELSRRLAQLEKIMQSEGRRHGDDGNQ